MLFSNAVGMIITSTILWYQNESTIKFQVHCPDAIKIYNQGIGAIDLVDQETAAIIWIVNHQFIFIYPFFFQLDERSFIVYMMMHLGELSSSTSKPQFPLSWLLITQAEVEPHQRIKPDQKEHTGTSMS